MPPMLTIHFVRHGDTTQAAEGVFCGDLDPPLTEHGRAQAELVARAVASYGASALYSSPKLRARQTAEPIARACRLQPVVEPGLREIAYGTWEGRTEADIRASDPGAFQEWTVDPALVAPPGGESAFQIAGRALPVVARIRQEHRTGHVLVVSHKATVRVIVCALLGVPLARFRSHIACPTASITTFELDEHSAMLLGAADVHHLSPPQSAGP
jgi:broad specificity phosphatase PhoE